MKPGSDLKQLLESYPPTVRDLALLTRKLVKETIPGVEETVDAPAKVIGYGFGSGYAGVVCTIILSKTGVKLGIVRGAELPDPKQLLEGSGKVHKYVQLNTTADLKKAGLRQLLKASYARWSARAAPTRT